MFGTGGGQGSGLWSGTSSKRRERRHSTVKVQEHDRQREEQDVKKGSQHADPDYPDLSEIHPERGEKSWSNKDRGKIDDGIQIRIRSTSPNPFFTDDPAAS